MTAPVLAISIRSGLDLDVYCDVIFLVNPAPGRSDCVLVIVVEVYDYF